MTPFHEPLLTFLRRAGTAVVSSGRYPVPKAASDMDINVSTTADLEWFHEVYTSPRRRCPRRRCVDVPSVGDGGPREAAVSGLGPREAPMAEPLLVPVSPGGAALDAGPAAVRVFLWSEAV